MTNPDNAVGTNAAYGGRTSVNAFNDNLSVFSRGILSGWGCSPAGGLTVSIGGNGTDRDVAVAEDNAGNKTSINNISGSPITLTISAAPGAGTRIDSIVAYVDASPQGEATVVDNYGACGLIVVQGTPSSTPSAPSDNQIRSAITSDGASGPTAYYVVLATITMASGTTDVTAGEIAAGDAAKIASSNLDFATIGTTLYSGDSHCPITLSDSAGNYEKIVIEYRCNNQTHASVDVYSPNNKDVLLSTGFNDRTNGFFLKTQNVLISGTSIDQVPNTYAREININGSTVSSPTVNNIWITKVTGYKSRI